MPRSEQSKQQQREAARARRKAAGAGQWGGARPRPPGAKKPGPKPRSTRRVVQFSQEHLHALLLAAEGDERLDATLARALEVSPLVLAFLPAARAVLRRQEEE